MAKKKEAIEDDGSKSQLGAFLKTNKDDHYNFEEEVFYKSSSGSLKVDYHLDGGLTPGIHRFCGINEGGKTSAALEFMRNHLNDHKGSKGFFVKAEGRLSEKIKERSGVKFTTKAEEWEEGTCFVFESNIYDTVVDALRELVGKNPEKNKYFFIIDSVDGLITKEDNARDITDSYKVAGGANLMARLLQKMSIALSKRGHTAIFISQVRDNVKIDPYAPARKMQGKASGGNALQHYTNWVLEFLPRNNDDIILKDPKLKNVDADKNPAIGHMAKFLVHKSDNEKSRLTISYPIKYKRKGGGSVWVEREVVDMLIMMEYLNRAGAWFSFDDDLRAICEKSNFSLPEKIQGLDNVYSTLENDEELTKFLINYFKNLIAEG